MPAANSPATPPVTPPPAARKGMGCFAKTFLVLIVVVGALAAVVTTRPDEFHISRSVTIKAPAASVFDQINNLRNFHTWNPFVEPDPQVKITYEGPEAGAGAIQKWSGNDQVGEGTMTITDSKSPEVVKMHLVFVRPMADESDTEFKFEPAGEGTTVTWSMSGQMNFIEKAVTMFMDMDKMVGGEFDRGLGKLKTKLETPQP